MKKIILLLITLVLGCSSLENKSYKRDPSSIEERDRLDEVYHGNYDRLR